MIMNRNKSRLNFLSIALFVAQVAVMVVAEEEEELTMAEKRKAAMSKKWYMQKITIGEKRLPMSPVSIVVGFLSLYFLYSNWPGNETKKSKVFCEASHILIMDHSKDTKEKLLEFQTKIQSDPQVFAKLAKKHSACPSKSNGGNLGKFRPGDMAPPFDKLCFDPSTPMNTTVGPVQTNFGWHLIYIHTRQLSER